MESGFQGEGSKEEHAALEHYKLDDTCGWMFMRWRFAWATKHRPKLGSMTLMLRADEKLLAGPHFPLRRVNALSLRTP